MKFYGALFVVLFGAFAMYCASVAQGPEFEIPFERSTRSEASPAQLGRALRELPLWPGWFHSLKEAQTVDAEGRALPLGEQVARAGARIRLFIEPPKRQWKRFELGAEIVEFVPKRKIRIRVLSDSKDKLNQLFSLLEWEVELVPEETGGTRIIGRAVARARNWRGKVFGSMTPNILMFQVYYPDLMALSKLTPPLEENAP